MFLILVVANISGKHFPYPSRFVGNNGYVKFSALISSNIPVLTETVIPYLSEDTVASLRKTLRTHKAIRYWLVDYFSPASYEYRRRSGMSKVMANSPFLFEPKDYFGFFLSCGWRPKETRYFAIEAERLRRPAPFPLIIRLFIGILGMFILAECRREMKSFVGFVRFKINESE